MKNGWHVERKGTKHERRVHYLNDSIHREDGPAIIWVDGSVEYYREGKLHREDGPAVIYAKGTVAYYREGKRHREDGPAVVNKDGSTDYYLNGNWLSKADYWAKQGGELGRILYGGQK